MTTRRSFLKQASLIAPAIMFAPDLVWAAKKKSLPVGIQLYTLRELIGKDPKGVIEKVAAAGYKEVELFGYNGGKFFGMPVADFAGLLKANGLNAPSGHYMPQKFLYEDTEAGNAEMKELIGAAAAMKHTYLTIPWLHPDKRSTIDGYKRLAAQLNKAGEWCKQSNLQLAYHNHDFEFATIDGQTGYNILLNETDKDLVKFELDIYWAAFSGVDVIDLFRKNSGRIHMWHVKDMDKNDRKLNTEIGNGTIDFKPIFAQAKLSGLKHIFVEQENNYAPDPIGSIGKSYQFIKQSLLKK